MTLRITLALAVVGAGTLTACGDRRMREAEVTPADVVAGAAQTYEQFVSQNGRFTIHFPQTWRGGYSAVERADTSLGARLSVEFVFKPNPDWKVPPRTLLLVRVFPRAAWERLAARTGPPVALKIAERGDEVFGLSFPPQNPYAAGTPAAARFDELVLAVMQDPVPLRLTPR